MKPIRFSVAAITASFLLLISGCAETPPADDSLANDTTVNYTATVEKRTITDVLTLNAVVTSGVDYTISAPQIGKLQEADGAYTLVPSDSSHEPIPLHTPDTAENPETLVPLDTEVGAGTPLLRVHNPALNLQAEVAPAQVLRINGRKPNSVRAQIDGSSGPFDCNLADHYPTSDGETYTLYCSIPTEVPAIPGATGLIALNLDEREDTLALPIEAVAGTREAGVVYRADSHEKVSVELGISDGSYIEIRSGLSHGDEIAIPSPSMLSEQ